MPVWNKMDELGFSLVEVLLAAGISITVVYAVSMVMVSQSNEIARLRSKQESISIALEIQSALFSPVSCARLFGIGGSLNPVLEASAQTTAGQDMRLQLNNGEIVGGTSGRTPGSYQKIEIQSIKLRNVLPAGTLAAGNPVYTGSLTLDTRERNQTNIEFAPQQLGQFTFVTNGGGAFTECYVVSSSTQSTAAVCASLGLSIRDGKCVQSPEEICVSLGGTFAAGECSLGRSVAANPPATTPPDDPPKDCTPGSSRIKTLSSGSCRQQFLQHCRANGTWGSGSAYGPETCSGGK